MKLNALIVDDDITMTGLLTTVLKSIRSFERIDVAHTLESALHHISQKSPYHILLTDGQFPEKDGAELTSIGQPFYGNDVISAARAKYGLQQEKYVLVIGISSAPDNFRQCDVAIKKPLQPREFLSQLNNLITKKFGTYNA